MAILICAQKLPSRVSTPTNVLLLQTFRVSVEWNALFQILMQVAGQPGNLIVVPKGTKPGTVVKTPKGRFVLEHTTGVAAKSPSAIKQDFIVTTENVERTLDRALASTESMAMLLRTLKEDLRPALQSGVEPAKARSIKLEVAKKVRRALDAQFRTMNELHQFTKNSASPKQTPSSRAILPANTQGRSLLKPTQSGASVTPRVQDVPELQGMNIGEILTPSRLSSAVGDKVIISKETLSGSNIQLVTLSDGRVLAVQTAPGAKQSGPASTTSSLKEPASGGDIIELDSSEDESPQTPEESPPRKKYKPGPKCSKVNRPGPKCSKVGRDTDKSEDKFRMKISLGAKSFPGTSTAKTSDKDSDGGKSHSDASLSDDDKPLKPRLADTKDGAGVAGKSKPVEEEMVKESEKKNDKTDENSKAAENDEKEEKESEDEKESDDKDSSKSPKKDEDDDDGGSSSGNKGGSSGGTSGHKEGNDNDGKDSDKSGDADDTKDSGVGEDKMEVDQDEGAANDGEPSCSCSAFTQARCVAFEFVSCTGKSRRFLVRSDKTAWPLPSHPSRNKIKV